MQKQVLISGAGIAGLTLAYWLNRYGYKVAITEIAKTIRKGGSPIDVRGEALAVAEQMGVLQKIKAKEFIHTDEIVNVKDETLVHFSINAQTEYSGDIEIHREDLATILYENIPHSEVEFLFDNRIEKMLDSGDKVKVTFKTGEQRNFDFVFGADGTHSVVRKLIFGDEEQYSKFFGAYFAISETPDIKPNRANPGALMYHEPGKMAALFPFKEATNAFLVFRSPQLKFDYRNTDQHKQILEANFSNSSWRIPEILDAMLRSDNLYFDEVCQIHMPSWTKGRVALLGDAAHTTSFPTGMGTSLAMQGATILANKLNANNEHQTAFMQYNESYKPYVENIQSRINRGLNWLIPETEEGIQQAIERFKK